MTPDMLIALLGAVLSLVFAYLPWLKDKFDNLPDIWKPILNAGLLLALALALVGLGCLGIVSYFACSWLGVLAALKVWFFALLANQLTYQVLVRQPKKLLAARAAARAAAARR